MKERKKKTTTTTTKELFHRFSSLSRARSYLDGVGHVRGQLLGALEVARPGVCCFRFVREG